MGRGDLQRERERERWKEIKPLKERGRETLRDKERDGQTWPENMPGGDSTGRWDGMG